MTDLFAREIGQAKRRLNNVWFSVSSEKQKKYTLSYTNTYDVAQHRKLA